MKGAENLVAGKRGAEVRDFTTRHSTQVYPGFKFQPARVQTTAVMLTKVD